jgi:hypothetical protein
MKTTELFRTLSLTVLVSAPLFACGGVESAPDEAPAGDEASDEAITIGPLLDLCRVAAADATATLSANDDSDRFTSGSLAYGSRSGCTRFVADFVVAPNAEPADNHGTMDFLADGTVLNGFGNLSAANCTATRVSVTRYRRTAGATSFVRESSATYSGAYTAPTATTFGGCYAVLDNGDQAAFHQPNPAGSETYRIAVRATRNNVVIPVEASIGFQIIPF